MEKKHNSTPQHLKTVKATELWIKSVNAPFIFSTECSNVMSIRACRCLRFLNEPCPNHKSKTLKSAPCRSIAECFSSYYFFLFPTPSHSHRFNFRWHSLYAHPSSKCMQVLDILRWNEIGPFSIPKHSAQTEWTLIPKIGDSCACWQIRQAMEMTHV